MRSQPSAKKQALPPGHENWPAPWVLLRTITFNPAIFPAMIRTASPEAKPGSLVSVYDKEGRHFGSGFYDPKARIPLRIFRHGEQPVGEEYFAAVLERAVDWRRQVLQLEAQTNAYRVVNSDGDGLSGLVVDRYGEVLSVVSTHAGVTARLPGWIALLHERLGTRQEVVEIEEQPAKAGLRPVRITENGMRFEVDFSTGHKTGFFCDQRDNRLKFARLVQPGMRVLDLCCYSGGFAVTAAVRAEPGEVTGVDLDEAAIAQARRNGNLNQKSRLKWIHADAFAYARQMMQNGEQWQALVLDPPKFLDGREEQFEGRRKYEDLNRLAIALVAPGGLFVSCSCSGLWNMEEFERVVTLAAHRQNRRLQFFDRTGAGPDHPVMSNAPEGRYLKVLWARVF